MTDIKVTVIGDMEHRHASVAARRSGTARQKIQQLIDLYSLHPGDSDVPVSELIENLKILQRTIKR